MLELKFIFHTQFQLQTPIASTRIKFNFHYVYSTKYPVESGSGTNPSPQKQEDKFR